MKGQQSHLFSTGRYIVFPKICQLSFSRERRQSYRCAVAYSRIVDVGGYRCYHRRHMMHTHVCLCSTLRRCYGPCHDYVTLKLFLIRATPNGHPPSHPAKHELRSPWSQAIRPCMICRIYFSDLVGAFLGQCSLRKENRLMAAVDGRSSWNMSLPTK